MMSDDADIIETIFYPPYEHAGPFRRSVGEEANTTITKYAAI
jgi:hypothetical protein